ncbi:EMILIN-1-like [Mercenaria mercenaria]|uniref:EMILIN-1-like n=1 Tax=Mercenaria mercenaria TaxID=6596 RepID=UPI00234E5FED|nr:EMILIN-1-like [Mercenaria mercenaria]
MSSPILSFSVFFIVIVVFSLSGSEASSAPSYEQLVERIIQLEKKVDQSTLLASQYERNSRLSRQLQIMESRISSLVVQQENSNRKQAKLEARIIELEEQALNHKMTIEQQRAEIDNLKARPDRKYNDEPEEETVEKLPEGKRIQQSEIPWLSSRGRITKKGERRGRSFPETPVAFTALLDHNVDHSGIDQTVIFNNVLLNDGNAYNSHTGVFTAPREGLYLFYFAFGAGYEPHKLWMHIVVDGQGKASGVADTWQRGHDAQGTNLVLLHLQQGDSVWVATYKVADKSIYGFPGGFTTFSGVLLYEY